MAYTPKADREMKGGKAVVSAQELADFREKFGKDQTLRDLLNMDKGLQRKLEIPKAMRNLPDNKNDDNPPIRIPKSMLNLPANERDPNIADKAASLVNTFYKKGGSVSASRRADGIAQRGKTRGKMC